MRKWFRLWVLTLKLYSTGLSSSSAIASVPLLLILDSKPVVLSFYTVAFESLLYLLMNGGVAVFILCLAGDLYFWLFGLYGCV